MNFTILGSTGFIGCHLAAHLRAQGIEVKTPPRDAADLRGQKLGHVIYAIGLTGNFRRQPRAAVEAHVSVLQRLIDGADFESWLYLSSTRVYGGLGGNASTAEDAALSVKPGADALYDLSKLLGEAICLGIDHPKARVARLSNVYGAEQSRETFLGAIMAELAEKGGVSFREAPLSSKNYISIDDAVNMLQNIALGGRERLYNVAGGKNVTHRQLAEAIAKSGYEAGFAENAPQRSFPAIDTVRLTGEFGPVRHALLDDLPLLIEKAIFFHNNTNRRVQKNEQVQH